jgi:hypothetical protein
VAFLTEGDEVVDTISKVVVYTCISNKRFVVVDIFCR